MRQVTIITVCYNSQSTIQATIESVLQQTYLNIEYIIVDGGSTDNTLNIIDQYRNIFGNRLVVISEQDSGIYDAMNKGILKAHGELIGILNSDDFYERNAVENIVNNMRSEKYQILYGFVRAWKEGKEYGISRLSHEFMKERMIGHPACFVTKSTYSTYGMFDVQYPCVADYDFMLRMLEKKDVFFVPVNEIIANFRMGGVSASEKAWLDLLNLKKNHKLISKRKYQWEILKGKIYHFAKRIVKCLIT